jgi:multiple sugar transport system permease protein
MKRATSLHRLPAIWRTSSTLLVATWLLVALFPIAWLVVMSVKLPIDAFAPNVLDVLRGPDTRARIGGPSGYDLMLGGLSVALAVALHRLRGRLFAPFADASGELRVGGTVLSYLTTAGTLGVTTLLLTPWLGGVLEGATPDGPLSRPLLGATLQHFRAVWVDNAFYVHLGNSLYVTGGVVAISLTIGALAGYGLARKSSRIAFWILIAALVFRALPHSTLVTGYLPPFIEFGLYGRQFAVIIVLVAINQPFTIWMLRSFFANVPSTLDEAAMVDGATRLQAFWHVVMPVMWPGVITTGLFSFMLAYNDYLVAALLLDGRDQTMVPAIMQYFNRETTLGDQLEAIAAAVSITGPLFLIVLVFQRQIVSGLTQGAVKG